MQAKERRIYSDKINNTEIMLLKGQNHLFYTSLYQNSRGGHSN